MSGLSRNFWIEPELGTVSREEEISVRGYVRPGKRGAYGFFHYVFVIDRSSAGDILFVSDHYRCGNSSGNEPIQKGSVLIT